jgi:ADP-dependent NAD(P)H-hydrate dehydratase / NAD(P)H-hydrate epimerase
MRGVHSVAQVRAAESDAMARLPEGELMQRAAHALSVQCAALLGGVYGARVTLLVGSGNNGGDALFAGARLAARGARVDALLLDPVRAHADGLLALDRARGRAHEADPDLLAGADLVVDGMFGIGGRAGLTGPAAELADAAHDLLTVAVDVPSGVDADTGAAGEAAVRADVTVTFGAVKAGTVLGPGAELCGELRLVDLGLELPATDAHLLEAADVRAVLPTPRAADDKYTRGVVGLAAGSEQYAGAGVLATGSAVHGGAGMVRYVGLAPDPVRARYPEVVVHPDSRPRDVRVQAWVVGPGLGTDDTAMALLADVLATDVPVIADADAITLIARTPRLIRGRSAPTVITPHDREFERIAGKPGPDRLAAARRAARDLGATVLLKGNATVVAAPDGAAYINPTGTPWLATAGSGDVLSGLIGALLAGGLPAPLAAAAGAYVHGVAGQRAAAGGPPSAADVLAELRGALGSLATG